MPDTIIVVELRAVPAAGPGIFEVFHNDEYYGGIEQVADGTWIGDVTLGNGPPSKPYATRDEAIAYVVNPTGAR